jgi:hypothetical protein
MLDLAVVPDGAAWTCGQSRADMALTAMRRAIYAARWPWAAEDYLARSGLRDVKGVGEAEGERRGRLIR